MDARDLMINGTCCPCASGGFFAAWILQPERMGTGQRSSPVEVTVSIHIDDCTMNTAAA